MVVFDRRSEFAESDSHLPTVAAEAHELYESDEFQEDLVDALGPVFQKHLDCEAVDAEAEEVLREWVAKEGVGGLYQIRNQIVTNREADLDKADVIYMTSARDGDKVIPHVVRAGDPPETGVGTYRVDPDDGEVTHADFGAGFVKHDDRFEVDRSERGRHPRRVASEIGEKITDDVSEEVAAQ